MLGAAPRVPGGQLGRSVWRNPRNPQHAQQDPSRPQRAQTLCICQMHKNARMLGVVAFEWATNRFCPAGHPGPWAQPRALSPRAFLCILHMHRVWAPLWPRGVLLRVLWLSSGGPTASAQLATLGPGRSPEHLAPARSCASCICTEPRPRRGLEGSCCVCCGFRGFRQSLLPSWPPRTLGAAPSIMLPRVSVHLAYALSLSAAGK
jgi:hypothetical protein